jgi:protein-S-isoprenylcysteine O-methyltransferase Ste14
MGRSPNLMLVALHLGEALWIVIPFVYFITAGAKTFTVPALRDGGAQLGQYSFVSAMVCVLFLGFYQSLVWYQMVCGTVLALCSIVLYEWTRRTVIDRNFYTGLGGEVPSAVCERGPYQYIRHPFYLSYMVAFLAVVAAFPSVVTAAVCTVDIALFVYMAFDDERCLLQSELAANYEAYRRRVGMFLPFVGQRASRRD